MIEQVVYVEIYVKIYEHIYQKGGGINPGRPNKREGGGRISVYL